MPKPLALPAMKSLLRKNVLFLCSSSSPRVLITGFQACELSSSPCQWREEEEVDSRNVRVSVWWDLKNCKVPPGFDASNVAPTIMKALRAKGIRGPLDIFAFGNVQNLPRPDQEALAATGVRLKHVIKDEANSSTIIVDLMSWVFQNPPPAYLFLISGDREFGGLLQWLRTKNYNILLATPEKTPAVLCSAATTAWHWFSLLKGEDLTGKHLNRPPYGLFASWYGSYEAPLDKPFTAEQSKSLPKSIVKQVRHMLSLHPNGISVGEFRIELAKCDVHLDKGLYGYKKFSAFLSAIPNVWLEPLSNGNFNIHLAHSESPASFENRVVPSTASAVKSEESGYAATPKLNGEDKNKARDVDETSSIASFCERSMDDGLKSFQPVPSQGKPVEEYVDGKSSFPSLVERHIQPPNELQRSSVASDNVLDVANAQRSEFQLPPKGNKVSKTKMGSLKMTSQKPSDSDIVRSDSENSSHKILEKHTTSGDNSAGNDHTMVENNAVANYESENFTAKNKYENPTRKEVVGVCHSSYSSPTDDSLVDKRPDGSAETDSRSVTFFSWIRSLWPSWKSNAKCDDSTAHQNKVASHVEDSKLSERDQTVSHQNKEASHVEDSKLSEPDQTVSHQNKVASHVEDSKLSELDQTVSHQKKVASHVEDSKLSERDQTVSHQNKVASHVEDSKLSEPDQTVSHQNKVACHVEDSKLSEPDQTVSHFEEPKLSKLDQNVSHSGKPELFSSVSFWNDMKSFVFTPKGSLLVSQSKSREDMAHKLQNGGPQAVRSLTKEDILQLVELLIAEKKWLEETPSRAYPFSLTEPLRKNSLMGQSHGANGLRSLFLSGTSQPNFQNSFQYGVEKHNQTTSHSGVSTPATTESKCTDRSRNDILEDCQALVDRILREHPEGYNIGSFQKHFVDCYGYHLDIQKLGYKKLASLLQIMPGVKVESTYIFPSVPDVYASDLETSILKTQVTNDISVASNSDSELSESSPKDDDMESPWEELGPVSVNNSNENDLELKSIAKNSENANVSGNSLLHIFNLSSESTRGNLSKIPSGYYREKQRSPKNHSFVADPVTTNEEELIDDKKADEPKMQN